MSDYGRRELLRGGFLGLATGGAAGLVLRADAKPTPANGDLADYKRFLDEDGNPRIAPTGKFAPTVYNTPGPFYRGGAPFRGKVTAPLEPGPILLIRGRVWGHDTRRPLAGCRMDIWQADIQGHYDNDDPANPPANGVLKNRIRLVTDESGAYEYETVHPGAYQIGRNTWRPPHIHYLLQHPGYRRLTTQLYFRGDPHQEQDTIIRPSLIIDLQEVKVGEKSYRQGVFDVVLAQA